MWDGYKIQDLNPGITSHVSGKEGADYYERYIKWLESVAE
jgi:hypothetical protein